MTVFRPGTGAAHGVLFIGRPGIRGTNHGCGHNVVPSNLPSGNREEHSSVEMGLCTSSARLVDLCRSEIADINEVHKLIKGGANVNYVLKRKEKIPWEKSRKWNISTTALCSAVQMGRIDIVSALLDAGANPIQSDEGDIASRTPLHHAVDFPDIVSLLLERSTGHFSLSLVHTGDGGFYGLKPLHSACEYVTRDNVANRIKTIGLLIKSGCEVDSLTQSGLYFYCNISALMVAVEQVHPICCADHGVCSNCSSCHCTQIIQCLLDYGADVNLATKGGNTALHTRSGRTTPAVAQLLIDKGVDVSRRNSEGKTPVFFTREEEVLKILLANGADINARDDEGRTALFDAISSKKYAPEWWRVLLHHGCDPNICDDKGVNPIELAVTENHREVAHEMSAPHNDNNNSI